MDIKIGIIGGSPSTTEHFYQRAGHIYRYGMGRAVLAAPGRRNRGHSRGRIGASWAQPYDCALFSQLPG